MQNNLDRLILLAVILLLPASVFSQGVTDSVVTHYENNYVLETDSMRLKALDTILSRYNDWQTIDMSGKLRANGLPVSLSLKLYMEKGSDIILSVRAPFVGEAGRIEICGDSITAVNKMKRVFCQESLSGILSSYPGFIQDLQSLLLGRIIVFGAGELSFANANLMEIGIRENDSGWQLIQPGIGEMISGLSFAFITDSAGRLSDLALNLSLVSDSEEGAVTKTLNYGLGYSYPSSNMDITIYKGFGEDVNEIAVLDFNSIKWGGSRPSPLKIDGRYRQVGVKDFFRSF